VSNHSPTEAADILEEQRRRNPGCPTSRHNNSLASIIGQAQRVMEQLNKRPQIHLRPSLHTYSFHNFLHSGQARWPTVFVQAGCIGRRSSVSARLCTRILTPNLAHTPHQPLPKLHLCDYQWRGRWEHRLQASRINVNRMSLIDMTKGRIDSMPGTCAPSAISNIHQTRKSGVPEMLIRAALGAVVFQQED
jgi:hypothetical protein